MLNSFNSYKLKNLLFILLILFVIVLLLSIFISRQLNLDSPSIVENYGWSCTYTPNKNYYAQDWLLGGNEAGMALARDSIKPF